jgi:hypothetical protein
MHWEVCVLSDYCIPNSNAPRIEDNTWSSIKKTHGPKLQPAKKWKIFWHLAALMAIFYWLTTMGVVLCVGLSSLYNFWSDRRKTLPPAVPLLLAYFPCVCVRIHLLLLRNGSANMLPQQQYVFYVVCVVSKESKWLVLPRTSCSIYCFPKYITQLMQQ